MERAFNGKTVTFEKGGRCGIPVRDAISKSYEGLEGRDSRPFQDFEVVEQPRLRIEVSG